MIIIALIGIMVEEQEAKGWEAVKNYLVVIVCIVSIVEIVLFAK